MKERKLNNKGFSLVELIIVIAIMVILVVVFAPQYLRFVNNSRISTDVQTAANMVTAIETSIAEGGHPFASTGSTNVTVTAIGDLHNVPNLNAWPAARMNGGAWEVIGNDVTGVDTVNLIVNGTHYECYPNPENTTNGINTPATTGLRQ